MKAFAFLVLLSGTALSQDRRPTPPDTMVAIIRATPSSDMTPISISLRGALFHSLGVASRQGSISLSGDGGTATGVIAAELSRDAGRMTFSSPVKGPELEIVVRPRSGARVPVLRATGHVVTVVRDGSGALAVRTGY